MKKIIVAAFLFLGCNSDDLDEVKKDISGKIPSFLLAETKGRLLVNDCTLYSIKKITEQESIDFRVKALTDSMIILNNLTDVYNRAIEGKRKTLREFDSLKQETGEVKRLISSYGQLIDSTIAASVSKKKLLDSLSLLKSVGSKDKNFYNTAFKVCSFNISAGSSCDSVAFLLDKKLNILSMHIVH